MKKNRKKESLKDSINTVIRNGERLLDDVDFLLGLNRASSAFVLSILAQEEFAKAFLLHLVETKCIPWNKDVKRTLQDHTCKQLVGVILEFLNPDDDQFLERTVKKTFV